MAEEEAVAEVAEVAPEIEPEQPETPVVEQEDDDKEPGGSDGASVRARRLYRESKQLKADLEQERAERIRVEERARLLEEQRNKPAQTEKERIYTADEVEAAVTAGTITRSQATVYLARVEAQRVRDEEVGRQRALAPIEKARAVVTEYCNLIPALNDDHSPEFRKVLAEYQEMIADGFPDDFRTRAAAAQAVMGDLATLRKRGEVNTLSRRAPNMPSDSSGGQVSKVAKPPPEVEALWDQMRTTPEQRKVEWAIMQKSKRT
jgi:hypothetical protein